MDEALSNHPMYYNHLLCSCKQAKLPVDQREFVKFTVVETSRLILGCDQRTLLSQPEQCTWPAPKNDPLQGLGYLVCVPDPKAGPHVAFPEYAR
jgi:hypothetical protein